MTSMKKPKIRELIEALRSLFSRPYTTRFPVVPHVPPEAYRGQPKFYEEDCVGCGACAEVCPSEAIKVVDSHKTRKRILIHRIDECLFCGQCERACLTGLGIRLSNEFELSQLNRTEAFTQIEKELVLCEACGEIIGTRDHLNWVSKKIGALAYTNPTLLLVKGQELKILKENISKGQVQPVRAQQFRKLCPACRRQVILSEGWG